MDGFKRRNTAKILRKFQTYAYESLVVNTEKRERARALPANEASFSFAMERIREDAETQRR